MSQASEPLLPHPDNVVGELAPLNRFTINTEGVGTSKHDLDLRLSALKEKMDKIARTFTIKMEGGGEFEVIPAIARHSRDKKELKGVAKGLDRYADHIEAYDKLKARVALLDMVADDPGFLAWALGDFEQDIDEELNLLLDDKDNP